MPILTTLTALGCLAPVSLAVAQQHNLSLGAFHSQGDYGQPEDTTLSYLPLSYDYSHQNWRFKLTVPYLRIAGSGNVLVNTGGVGRGEADTEVAERTVAADGVGDVLFSVSYQFPALFEQGPFLDISADVKLPTADEDRGLGTGERDYGLQLDLYQQLGSSTLFSTLGYRKRGQTALFAELQDTYWGSLGLMHPLEWEWLAERVPGRLDYGLIYDYREAASVDSTETHEVLPFVTWSPDASWTLMTYVVKGFTRDSADRAIGAQLSYRW